MKRNFMDIIHKGHRKQWAALFLEPTDNSLLQLGRGALVSAISFLVDYLMLLSLTASGAFYLVAAGFCYGVGMLVNFILSKIIVFNNSESVVPLGGELFGYLLICVVGLGITEVLLFLFTGLLEMTITGSKVLAALMVFAWNYAARKKFLYKKTHEFEQAPK